MECALIFTRTAYRELNSAPIVSVYRYTARRFWLLQPRDRRKSRGCIHFESLNGNDLSNYDDSSYTRDLRAINSALNSIIADIILMRDIKIGIILPIGVTAYTQLEPFDNYDRPVKIDTYTRHDSFILKTDSSGSGSL